MKCDYHPDKEAAGNCCSCQKPLCAECGQKTEGADIMCSRCAALSAANAAANGLGERKLERETRKAEAARKGKKPHVAMIVVIVLAALALLANVYMYMGPDVPEITQFNPDQHPLLTADLINNGIGDYAKEHGGQFPASLNVLLGKYIPYEEITPAVLERFSYQRFSPTSYELRFKDAENQEFSDIVFGKEVQ